MDDIFIKKVRAAAIAGWWTVLIAYCVLLIQWFAYLLTTTTTQPSIIIWLWGTTITWPEMRSLWLWAMVVYKIVLATMIFVVIWLTLWARRLAKK